MTPPFDVSCSEPFGRAACEDELLELGRDAYQTIFLSSVPFYENALRPQTYLVRGRRGSGKTALTAYFDFQDKIPGARCVVLDQSCVTLDLLDRFGASTVGRAAIERPRIARLWSFVLWSVVIRSYAQYNPTLANLSKAMKVRDDIEWPPHASLDQIYQIGVGPGEAAAALQAVADSVLVSSEFAQARELLIQYTKSKPLILALDTAEQYDTQSDSMMYALAALVECAANLNREFRNSGVLIKLFIADEIYPRLATTYISNTEKFVRDAVHLKWRPKDLLRLVCLRLSHFLSDNAFAGAPILTAEEWDDPQCVRQRVWEPCFGKSVESRTQIVENTFPYVMRHSQLRPRQLIRLCNDIAQDARVQADLHQRRLPNFHADAIRQGVFGAEIKLAQEIINSFSSIYPNLIDIVMAIGPGEARFKGNELHKAASRSQRFWPAGEYDRQRFVETMVEMGVIGRERSRDDRARIIEADFQYNMDHLLSINEDDWCVVHPMFCGLLNRTMGTNGYVVLPFPDHPDFADLLNGWRKSG